MIRTAHELRRLSDDELILEIRDSICEAAARPTLRPSLRHLLAGELQDLNIVESQTGDSRFTGLPKAANVVSFFA